MDLLVVGNASIDTIDLGGQLHQCIGGTAIHFSVAASLAKSRVRPVSLVGHDFPLESIPRNDYLDLSHVRNIGWATSRFHLRYDASQHLEELTSFLPDRDPTTSELLPNKIKVKAAHLSCKAPFHPENYIPRIDGGLMSTDVSLSSLTKKLVSLEQVLPFMNYVFLNTDEYAIALTLMDLASYRGLNVVVTKAESGVEVFQSGVLKLAAPAYEVTVFDPTGAGDVLAGGCIGMLSTGASLEMALSFGAALASMCVEGLGSIHLLENPDLEHELSVRRAWIEQRVRRYGC